MAPQTFPQYLVSLGIPEEVAAVLDPAEFYDDLNRAWNLELRKLKGEPLEGADVSTFPADLMARAAEIPKRPDITEVLDRIDLQLRPDAERFPCFSAAQLNSGRFETRYLIPGLLVAGQPGGIFGAFKTLKTSITADLLISLASGTPFLGHFRVSEPGRTLFLSGESGLAALQSIARRICASRGLSLERLENFELSPKLPHLNSADDARALRRIVRDKRPVCVAIDPAYLAIQSEDYRNLFAMGTLLRPLAELCDSTGCTILIVHHCKRSRVLPNDPATLEDIAWSGFAEFSAQWLLLARRHRFDPDTGRHELWLNTGGRAGHHGLWALDVEEGTSGKPERRTWKPSLSNVRTAAVQDVFSNEDKRERQRKATLQRHRHRILEALQSTPGGDTARRLRNTLGLTCASVNAALSDLADEGLIVATSIERRDRVENGYRVVCGDGE